MSQKELNALLDQMIELSLGWRVALIALAIIIAFILLKILERFVLSRLMPRQSAATSQKRKSRLISLSFTNWLVLIPLTAYLIAFTFDLPERVETISQQVLFLACLLLFGTIVSSFAVRLVENYGVGSEEGDPASRTALGLIRFTLKFLVWAIIVLLALDNFGVNITALATGLGIGGVAVALAVQNILGDLFASLSIILDRPFVVGDFVVVGEHSGTVEHIGIKTTRIRSISGEQLVCSNSDLLSSRIRNFKRMWERRVTFSVGITYQTPVAKVAKISEELRRLVELQPLARFDRAHFNAFGDSALMFEIVYFVRSKEMNDYMDTQQSLNLAIMHRFQELGVEFAYPTRTVFLQQSSQAA